MKNLSRLLAVMIAFSMIPNTFVRADDFSPKFLRTISLPGVSGRLDHMAIDPEGGRLFVAALGNNSVEVIDLKEGKPSGRITGLKQPQGVCLIGGLNKLFVTTGGDGKCLVYDCDTLKPIGSISLGEDADNIRYHPGSGELLVGYGSGAISVIDPEGIRLLGTIPLAGHPESFQIDRRDKSYVNVPSAGHVAELDLKRRIVLSKWKISRFQSFFPMALDESRNLLFIASRKPPALLVLDTGSGRLISSIPCGADADDLFYDKERRLIYISCGEGILEIFKQIGTDEYRSIIRLPTAPGARTSLWAPELNRIFVASPSQKGKPAAILIYAIDDVLK